MKYSLGNVFSPMMIRSGSIQCQNSINNPEESYVDDFDDMDMPFNQHVYTPTISNADREALIKVNIRPRLAGFSYSNKTGFIFNCSIILK